MLLSNHDGAAAPGPARLCNDLKQESRPQAPTPFQNMGHKSEERGRGVGGGQGGRTWDLEPGTRNLHLNLNLDLTSALYSTRLDSTRLGSILLQTAPIPSPALL